MLVFNVITYERNTNELEEIKQTKKIADEIIKPNTQVKTKS